MSSTTSRRLRLADIEPMPWKNGGGVTREIATGGVPAAGDGWGWRVSVAEVTQDGPFSRFPEVDRVIAVIAGAGMDLLRDDGTTLALEPFQPVGFAGEEALSGRLREGPVRDLNAMVRRGHFRAEMAFLEDARSAAWSLGAGDCLLVLSLAGAPSVRVGSAPPLTMATGEIVIHEAAGNAKVTVARDARAAVIRIARPQER